MHASKNANRRKLQIAEKALIIDNNVFFKPKVYFLLVLITLVRQRHHPISFPTKSKKLWGFPIHGK